MTIAYNDGLRRAHGRTALRPVDYPARTLGIAPWVREAPVAVAKLRPETQEIDTLRVLADQVGSYEGVPGRGDLTPKPKELANEAWFGPEVV